MNSNHPELPSIPTERELRLKIADLQKKMGIPTEDEYNPLAPGAIEELWPGGPGTEWFTGDIRNV